MPNVTVADGTSIFFKDWGAGRPLVFSHGWPLSADAWDGQMLSFGQRGYRVVAHDRRGHGRSSQTWLGNDMDTYADDLARVFDELDLRGAVLIGHSTGGGEVARYVGRHGTKRLAGVVLLGAVPPGMLKSEANPDGTPLEVFDEIRAGVKRDRAQYFRDLTIPFYGANRPGAKVSEGVRDSFWRMSMQGGIKAEYDCIEQFSATDFTADLRKIDVPTLIVHGDDDQIVPIGPAALRSAKLVRGAKLVVIPGGAHGVAQVDPDAFDTPLLEFLESLPAWAASAPARGRDAARGSAPTRPH